MNILIMKRKDFSRSFSLQAFSWINFDVHASYQCRNDAVSFFVFLFQNWGTLMPKRFGYSFWGSNRLFCYAYMFIRVGILRLQRQVVAKGSNFLIASSSLPEEKHSLVTSNMFVLIQRVLIGPKSLIFIPFDVIYPVSPTPALDRGTSAALPC